MSDNRPEQRNENKEGQDLIYYKPYNGVKQQTDSKYEVPMYDD